MQQIEAPGGFNRPGADRIAGAAQDQLKTAKGRTIL